MFELRESSNLLLSILVLFPGIAGLLLLFVPQKQQDLARNLSIAASGLIFVCSLLMLRDFDASFVGFQMVEQAAWIPVIGAKYILGVDGLSLWLIVLTTLLTTLVLIASKSVEKKTKAYLASLLILETGMLGTFLALDALLFYVFWELMLIPMYFLIGIWGGERRLYAAIKFVLYTAFGSLLMLVAIAYLAHLHQEQYGSLSFYLADWARLRFSLKEQIFLFLAFALAFSIKIPLFPLHTWLPDAHVEAPTGGSVILAGILLKMGLYGLIRFCVPLFPEAVQMFAPLLAFLGVVGIVYGALVAWVQTDVKKLVAYSSVSHLGFCVLGFAAMNIYGMQGCILQMLNHGVSTAALFFCVGVLYERRHTRLISEYGGLASVVPKFAIVFFVFTLSSIGLPLTNGFVGEFLILLGGFKFSALFGSIAVSGVILGAMYMLSLYRRVIFGKLDAEKNNFSDLTMREQIIFAPLLILVLFVGLYPKPILERMEPTSQAYVERMKNDKRPLSPNVAVVKRPELEQRRVGGRDNG